MIAASARSRSPNHQTRGEHGAEEGVCLAAVHKAGDKADNQTDQPRPQAVAQRSAEHDAKAHTGQNVADVVDARAVGAAVVQRLTQPAEGLVGRGLFRADAAAQGVELFELFEVVAVEADAPQHHQGLAVGGLQADGDAVGDGEHLALDAVGAENAVDGVLHAEGLRAGHGQVIAHGRRQIGQKVVIHMKQCSCESFDKRAACAA